MRVAVDDLFVEDGSTTGNMMPVIYEMAVFDVLEPALPGFPFFQGFGKLVQHGLGRRCGHGCLVGSVKPEWAL